MLTTRQVLDFINKWHENSDVSATYEELDEVCKWIEAHDRAEKRQLAAAKALRGMMLNGEEAKQVGKV